MHLISCITILLIHLSTFVCNDGCCTDYGVNRELHSNLSIFILGELKLGAAPLPLATLNLLDPSLVNPTSTPGNAILSDESFMPQVFRGCLGAVRVQEVLVPFFSQTELLNNSAANQFLRQVSTKY